ncbi:hypothetical protein NA56DRAFT_705039 [Hyaloscypha hepaticicola]|uniref:CFEM domain-containing protein n=1 Tax=Hyaloscypha hepaticicola TaxID=2082293 RepID=A0A2J6Q0J3_9HELO|nr:hypothetical protein NA56DRAFT_705039 [Hyaloscypha hepaticicola]
MQLTWIALALSAAVLATAQTYIESIDFLPCVRPCVEDAIVRYTSCLKDETPEVPCLCRNYASVQNQFKHCSKGHCGESLTDNVVLPTLSSLCEDCGF